MMAATSRRPLAGLAWLALALLLAMGPGSAALACGGGGSGSYRKPARPGQHLHNSALSNPSHNPQGERQSSERN